MPEIEPVYVAPEHLQNDLTTPWLQHELCGSEVSSKKNVVLFIIQFSSHASCCQYRTCGMW